ncbi:MAG: oligosaccharide flippase family protein [Proteobacteria bacterium]|nr:oligosaccharide flippase family protein [Pseudomonadota bacterium]
MAEPGRDLGRRFVIGTLYLGGGNWISYALNFVLAILIARTLGPDLMGLYALVFAVHEILNLVGSFSIGMALIQSPTESEEQYDTGFVLLGVLGLVGLVAAFAVAIAFGYTRGWLYAQLLVGLGFARVFEFLALVPLAKLERDLRYGRVALVHMLAGNLPNIAAIGLAISGAGVWSLLARDGLHAALVVGLGFALSSYRYRGRGSRASARQLMTFSKPMFWSRALEGVMQRVDRLVVGVAFSDRILGFYSQARNLSEAGQLALRPMSRLSFNLYSRLQDDPRRLARAYGIVNYFLVRAVFAGVAALLVFPDETIRFLLGPDWLEAAPLLRGLALYAGFLPLFENMKQLLYGRGLVAQNVSLRLKQLAVLLPGLAAAALFERVDIVVAALVATTMLGVLLARSMSRDVLEGGLFRLLGAPGLALATTLLIGSVLQARGMLDAVAFWLLPFAAPLLYGLVVLMLEGRRPFRELAYLRSVLSGSS